MTHPRELELIFGRLILHVRSIVIIILDFFDDVENDSGIFLQSLILLSVHVLILGLLLHLALLVSFLVALLILIQDVLRPFCHDLASLLLQCIELTLLLRALLVLLVPFLCDFGVQIRT